MEVYKKVENDQDKVDVISKPLNVPLLGPT
jgi:hypothetical protein